jgi:hypothetical protein
MDYIRRNIKFVFILVLPVYLYIVQSSILNKHTHFYSNGIVVSHSHPFNSESEVPFNHEHSESEINLFCDLNIDFHFAPEHPQLDNVVSEFLEKHKLGNEKFTFNLFDHQLIPRGPPTIGRLC